MPAGDVEHENDNAVFAGAGFLGEGRSNSSKNGFDTPLATYQKHSPVAGETKAVRSSHSKR